MLQSFPYAVGLQSLTEVRVNLVYTVNGVNTHIKEREREAYHQGGDLEGGSRKTHEMHALHSTAISQMVQLCAPASLVGFCVLSSWVAHHHCNAGLCT